MYKQEIFLKTYACTGIIACFICQVENHSKIANIKNIQKFKPSILKSIKHEKKIENILYITRQTRFSLQFNNIVKKLLY